MRSRPKAPDVHLSTIYRNLEELEHLGLISHSHLGHGPSSYLLAIPRSCPLHLCRLRHDDRGS